MQFGLLQRHVFCYIMSMCHVLPSLTVWWSTSMLLQNLLSCHLSHHLYYTAYHLYSFVAIHLLGSSNHGQVLAGARHT